MTDEQINIAIAETCGWTEVEERKHVSIDYDTPSVTTRRGIMGYHENYDSLQFISNYCNDLNAMHEAEQILWGMDWNNRYAFNDHLANILRGRTVNRNEWDAETLLDATAAQRAEAFLKTINLWKE